MNPNDHSFQAAFMQFQIPTLFQPKDFISIHLDQDTLFRRIIRLYSCFSQKSTRLQVTLPCLRQVLPVSTPPFPPPSSPYPPPTSSPPHSLLLRHAPPFISFSYFIFFFFSYFLLFSLFSIYCSFPFCLCSIIVDATTDF